MKKRLFSAIVSGAMLLSTFGTMSVFAEDSNIIETINNATDLANFAASVNEGDSYSGKTVTLSADIDLDNAEWIPIGTADHPFDGTFDGKGKTISNYKITTGGNNLGLFGVLTNGSSLKSVNISNVNITGTESVGGLVGKAVTGTIDNCNASNVTINAKHWAGGIGGYTYANYANCNVDNITITLTKGSGNATGDKAGALVGLMGEGKYSVTDCTATDVKITALRDAGGLVGATAGSGDTYTVLFENCNVTGTSSVSATATGLQILSGMPAAGGILGRNNAVTTFTNCSSNAVLSSTRPAYANNPCGMNSNIITN